MRSEATLALGPTCRSNFVENYHPMSLNETKDNPTPSEGLFRTLLTDSKLLYLTHALEQYEHAQLHLRQNEEQHRQVRQYLEYNRLRLFELDLRERFILESKTANLDLSNSSEHRDSSLPSNIIPLTKPPTPSMHPKSLPLSMKRISPSKGSFPLITHRIQADTGSSESVTRTYEVANPLRPQLPAIGRFQKDVSLPGPSTQQTETLNGNNVPLDSTVKDGHDNEDASKEDTKRKHIVRDYNEFSDTDVLFERGNFSYNHPGNRRYRAYVKNLQDKYIMSKKNDKIAVTTQVLNYIQIECGGRFLGHDEDGGQWRELTAEEARRKVGQSLRERNKKYLPPVRSRKNIKREHGFHPPPIDNQSQKEVVHSPDDDAL